MNAPRSRTNLASAVRAAPQPWITVTGSAVLADLSGFTRLTEALARTGQEGVEVLHRALNLCFATLLDPAVALGGDVLGFAGDAALVWFEGDDHARRAADMALGMPARLSRLPASLAGGKRLRVSVGVHTGELTAIVGGPDRAALFPCGPLIDELVRLQGAAEPGQVLASRELAAAVPEWARDEVADGVVLSRRGLGASRIALPSDLLAEGDASEGPGEHRAVAVGFLAVDGLGALLNSDGPAAVHAVLDRVAHSVSDVCDDLSIAWLDTDVGVGMVKLLITAGAPRATDDDEGRLLVGLRRLIESGGGALRAGAQRGPVFAGPLGVAGGRTFNIVGDAANVAARALGRAGSGELIAADGLGIADRRDVTARSLGTVALKNHVKPIELWRIDEVGPDVVRSSRGGFDGATTGVDAGRQRVRSGRQGTAATVLAARTEESENLQAAWKVVAEGGGRAIALVGESGMGSTELVAALVDEVGAACAFVALDRFRPAVPYEALAQVVRAMAPVDTGDAVDWLLAQAQQAGVTDSADLTITGLALRGVSADGSELGDGRVDDARPRAARVSATVQRALRAAVPSPFLLAIEDVDAVDVASWAVLSGLVDVVDELQWLVVVTAPPGGGESYRGFVTMELLPLPDGRAAELVAECAPRLRDDQVERVVRVAGGNPLLLAELAATGDAEVLPDSLERLAAVAIDALPSAIRRRVRDAAVLGTEFDLDTVAELLDAPELAQRGAWDAAASVLRESAPGVMTFRSAVLQSVAHGALTFQRRRALHGAIADRLRAEADSAAGAIVPHARLAHHLEAAGRQREAFPHAVAAARSARSVGALADAADLFRHAIRLAEQVDRSALAELHLQRGAIQSLLGDLDDADRSYAAAARVVADPLAYAEMCSRRAGLAIRRGRYKSARGWAAKGLAVVPALGPVSATWRVRLLLDDSAALLFLGRNAASLALANQALQACELADSVDQYWLGCAHLHLEMVHSMALRPEATYHGEQAIAIGEAIGDHMLLGDALINCGLTAMLEGRWESADAYYARAAAEQRIVGAVVNASVADTNRGFLLVRRGDVHGADALGAQSLRSLQRFGETSALGFAYVLRADVALALRELDRAREFNAAARAVFVHCEERGMIADCDVQAMEMLLIEGRPADALTLSASLQRSLGVAEPTTVVAHDLYVGQARIAMGDTVGGVAAIVAAADAARQAGMPYELYRCLAALLEVAAGGGPAAPTGAAEECDELRLRLGLRSSV